VTTGKSSWRSVLNYEQSSLFQITSGGFGGGAFMTGKLQSAGGIVRPRKGCRRWGWAGVTICLASIVLIGGVGCGTPKESPRPRSEIRTIEYTPPDIPLARRRQVYREVKRLIEVYEEKTRKIREDFVEGRISARQRDELLKGEAEKHDENLKATLGRYGLRMKDLPNILAEARDKGWD
jgi:hypothetical protein